MPFQLSVHNTYVNLTIKDFSFYGIAFKGDILQLHCFSSRSCIRYFFTIGRVNKFDFHRNTKQSFAKLWTLG